MRDDDFFWEGARDGKLLIQTCDSCRTLIHPPLPLCPNCQSSDTSPMECSGRGEVVGWVMSKHPTRQDDPDVRVVVLVQLEEGVRLVSNLQGVDFDAIDVGLPVEVFYQTFGEAVLPQFRPAGAA
jgi:uncharacterized OB-fold protein